MPPNPPAPAPRRARPAPPRMPANTASLPPPSPSSVSKTSRRSPTSRTTSWTPTSPSTPRNSSPSSASPSPSRPSSAPRAQNRNYLLGEGFHRMASKSNSWSLFLRYQAQAERHGAPSGPRAVEEFERLKALREELPNEAILEAQPEQTETTCTPSETNPSPPEDPAPAPDPPPRSPNWSWISPALRVFWKTPKSKRATQITCPPHSPQAPLSGAKPGACQNNAPGKRL